MPKEIKIRIPVYRPSFGDNERKYVAECIDSTWISSRGSFITRFEDSFSRFLDVSSSTSVSNGTVALHLALLALNIGIDDEVIVPTFTYIASVNSIAYVGAKPVFVDSDLESWNLDPQKVREKITSKTKAIMAVHLYGNPCDMAAIKRICEEFNLYLIEDAAEALGSQYRDQQIGSFGDIATFSFFGNKTLTTGEGGMVVSNNEELIEKVAFLKNQGVSKEKEYWHDEIGYNYRMTNIAAAIGLAQLERIEHILQKKQIIRDLYESELSALPIDFQVVEEKSINSNWMVSILAEDQIKRDNIREELRLNGIETRPFFNPVHIMPPFHNQKEYRVAESLGKRGLNLPSYPDLLLEDVKEISQFIMQLYNA